MLNAELKSRIERLLQGERRVEHLDRLFIGLRDRCYGRKSVRELGDFVAHRRERDRGTAQLRLSDIFTSFDSWARVAMDERPNLEQVRKTAHSNLRIATDQQLFARLAKKRKAAKADLERALRLAGMGMEPVGAAAAALNYLGGAFIWNPAITDVGLMKDFEYVLGKAGFLDAKSRSAFHDLSTFVGLYAVTVLHGSILVLENGSRVDLMAGFRNDERRLEVKGMLTLTRTKKPVMTSACVYWSSLVADQHCVSELLIDPEAWLRPLQLDEHGLVAPM